MGKAKRLRDRPVDIRALKGPDGTLVGDVRSLLAAITDPILYEERRVRLTALLQQIEKDDGRETRQALARALWPSVETLLAYRVEHGVMRTARDDDRRAKWTAPAAAISYLELLRAHYWPIDPIREPIEAAQLALIRFERLSADEQRRLLAIIPTPRRQKARGRSHLKTLNAAAKTALDPFVVETDSSTLRHLIGLY